MNIQKMMKQAQEMQAKIGQVQAEMEATEFSGEAASGAVTLSVTGKGELKSLKLKPEAVDPDDIETLEDLIIAAHRDAKAKADDALAKAMGEATGGMKLPGGGLPF